MSTDAQPAGSSPAVETPITTIPVETATDRAVASDDVAAFRAARLAERAGKPLELKPAESAPAEPADQAASTDAKSTPASEPGKPKKNADTRVQELLAERARERERAERAERRLAELEGRHQPAPPQESRPTPASEPAPAATFPSYDVYLETHPDASYEQYIDERTDFRFEQAQKRARAEAEAAEKAFHAARTIRERAEQFFTRIEDAKKADPAFLDAISAEVKALRPLDDIRDPQTGRWTERPTPYHWIAQRIVESPAPAVLMRHFSDHPDDLHRIAKLPPDEALEAMVALKLRATSETPAPAAPTKVISDAPEPTTLGGNRPSTPADPVEAAVIAGDQAAFKAARLAQRAATLR